MSVRSPAKTYFVDGKGLLILVKHHQHLLLMALIAVGAVKRIDFIFFNDSPKVPASGVLIGFPSKEWLCIPLIKGA